MSSPIRLADCEHFSIVRESLSLDGLHVAMVGRDRRQLLDYAAALAVALAEQDGWHIEKYDPQRLETLIVDLMLDRFDAALQNLSGDARTSPPPTPPGCVLFIPDAQSMSRAAFHQLVRLVAGTRNHRLRLVALFGAEGQACEDRIAAMGTQVARWDLDDDETPSAFSHPVFPNTAEHAFSSVKGGRRSQFARSTGRLMSAAAVVTVLAVLPMIWPAVSGLSTEFSMQGSTGARRSQVPELAGTLGPESLPITVKPENRGDPIGGNSATHGEAHDPLDNASSITNGTTYSINDGIAEPEAARP